MMSGQENSRRDAMMRQAASAGYNEEDFRRFVIKENIASTLAAFLRFLRWHAILLS